MREKVGPADQMPSVQVPIPGTLDKFPHLLVPRMAIGRMRR